jgi:DNA-binding CsgD family transcriptional regulator
MTGGGYSSSTGRELTPRMRDVLAAGAAGETPGQTAHRLGLSVHTVRDQRRAATHRLGSKTFTAAAVLAAREGLV